MARQERSNRQRLADSPDAHRIRIANRVQDNPAMTWDVQNPSRQAFEDIVRAVRQKTGNDIARDLLTPLWDDIPER